MNSALVPAQHEHQLWKDHAPSKDYFGSLDTLRFLAFLLVFANHVTDFLRFPSSVTIMGTPAFTYLQMGDLGVAFFFVLSGFLITYLLEKERVKTGTVSLKNFYIRRVLRIWPLYFLVLGIIVVISSSVHGFSIYQTSVNWKEISYHLFFVGNIFRAFQGTFNDMIAIFWSIAVEEQFYLVWPALFILFRKHIGWVLAIGVAISMAVRYHYANNFPAREFFTPSVMVYLMVGAFIGIHGPRLKHWLSQKKRALVVGLSAFAGVVILLSIRGMFVPAYPQWFIAIDGPIFAVFFAFIILSAVYGGFGKHEPHEHPNIWKRFKTFIGEATEYLGRVSYGLYVYHLVALTIVLYTAQKLFGFTDQNIGAGTFAVIATCALALVIGISALSYKFWEGPFLRLKDRFIPRS